MLKIAILAALGLAVAATPAIAQNNSGAAIAVPYADLNLTTESGRKALDRRLARAAREVCGGQPDLRNMRARTAFRECLAVTKARYEAQRLAILEAAMDKRIAVLADKLGFIAIR